MNPNILHVGLDVDDTRYHGSAFSRETGEVIDFRCRPTLKGLPQLDKLQRHFRGCSIRLCCEASCIGYCLQRDLLRTRQKLLRQREQLRRDMHALLRRNGLHYKDQTGFKSHWTKSHYAWLQRTIGDLQAACRST